MLGHARRRLRDRRDYQRLNKGTRAAVKRRLVPVLQQNFWPASS